MQVIDLYKKNLFPDFCLLAGSGGVFNTITTITVFDSPDIDKWLRGGELLIGNAYIFREDPASLENFLRKIREQGASALGIKLDRFLGELPKSVLDAADEIELPLILIPFAYRWADIIETVQRNLNTVQGTKHRKGAETKILEDFLEPTELAYALARELHHDVSVYCPSLELQLLVSSDGVPLSPVETRAYFEAEILAEEQLPTHGTIQVTRTVKNLSSTTVSAVYRSTGQGRTEVHVILGPEEKVPSLRQERLSMLVLTLIRSLALEQILGKQSSIGTESAFLEKLCLGGFSDQRIAAQRASTLGIVIPEPSFVTILQMIDFGESPEKGEEESFLFQIGPLRVSITPWSKRENHITKIAGICDSQKIWGVFGRKARGLLNIQESYLDCKKSISILKKTFLSPGAYSYEEATLFSLFRKMAGIGEGQVLINRYWQPLLEMPYENRTISPVKVVEAMVKNGFNAKRSAAELHVHYNTIRNYISEIQSSLDLEFDRPMDVLILTMCYFIYRERTRI
jgi:purine catabolism regulator